MLNKFYSTESSVGFMDSSLTMPTDQQKVSSLISKLTDWSTRWQQIQVAKLLTAEVCWLADVLNVFCLS